MTARRLVVPAAAEAKKAKTASVPVTFTVRNTDTSQFACTSDGGTYQIKGHITGPSSALASTATSGTAPSPLGSSLRSL